MLKDDLMSAITHAKALLREELYPMMAEIKEFYCLFTSSKKTKYHWENVLGNLTIDSWKIRQFNVWITTPSGEQFILLYFMKN